MSANVRPLVTCTTVLILVACSPAGPSGSVTGVTIDGGDRSIVVGDTPTFTATVDATGSVDTTVTWTNGDIYVATIDEGGTLTATAAGTTTVTATSTSDDAVSDTVTVTIDPMGKLGWTRQFGTDATDYAVGIATNADGVVYAVGYTSGTLADSSFGSIDGYVRAFDPAGTVLWSRQFGTAAADYAVDAATDAAGYVYVVGYTSGDLGGDNAGSSDGFVRSYDGNGNLRWSSLFGTSASEQALAVDVDATGTVYVTGSTTGEMEDGAKIGGLDTFLRSYDDAGNHRWTRQFGSSGTDLGEGVATDASGRVYVVGSTTGSVDGVNEGSYDVFVRAYDDQGTPLWGRQFGTSNTEFGLAIASDAQGNVYAGGDTGGSLEGTVVGRADAFVRSYDAAGTIRWTRQFGTTQDDYLLGLTTDSYGNVHAAGIVGGGLDGFSAGGDDAFVRSYDMAGNVRWTRQFGTSNDEAATAVTTDPDDVVYVAGYSSGTLEADNLGSNDGFVRVYGR